MGYQPNHLAAALRLNSTAMIGMVVPAISNPYYAALVEAVVHALSGTDRELLLSDSLDDAQVERARIHALLGRQVDGLIVVPCDWRRSGDAIARAAAAVPTVQLDRSAAGADTDVVLGDDSIGVGEALTAVAVSDTRSLHFISASQVSSAGQSRLRAFRAATGGRVPRRNEHMGEFTTEWGHQAADDLLRTARDVRGIVCGADVIALGVLEALRQHEVRVPQDIAVVGYDDIPFARLASPRLTTVRQPVDALARAAIQRLDARSASLDGPAQRTLIRPSLIVRETTSAASLGTSTMSAR